MKKLLALCLTVVLCLCCLASCKIFGTHSISYSDSETERLLMDGYAPTKASPGDTVVLRTGPIMDADLEFYANGVKCTQTHADSDYWEYVFTMPDEDVVITSDIIGGFEPKECLNHIDENNDGICDDCGHKHTITYVSAGTSGHFENYTCGCPHDHGAVPHYDENIDLICDVCEFNMSEIPTPTNHFLRNRAGCEWLNEITAEDIAEIKIIIGAVGVAPGNLNNVSSSTDEAVIARIFEEYYWLDTTPISQMEGQIDGGGGVTVKFILKDGTAKVLYINNGNYRDPDGNYFELLFTPKFKDTDNATKAHGFITYLGTGTVYDNDNNPVCEIPMDELEFIETDESRDCDTGYYYTVETEFGALYFDYSNVFYLKFNEGKVNYIEFYRLVGKNLDELIAEYSTNSESCSIGYQSDRTKELLMEDFAPTEAKPGDSVVLRAHPIMDADLAFYANGVKLTQTHADSDYWEYVFIMPDEDVVITHEITDGFLPA